MAGGHASELRILGEKDNVFFQNSFLNGGIRHSPLAKHNDVLDVISRQSQAAIKLEREVLVEEDFHETFWTAGGR